MTATDLLGDFIQLIKSEVKAAIKAVVSEALEDQTSQSFGVYQLVSPEQVKEHHNLSQTKLDALQLGWVNLDNKRGKRIFYGYVHQALVKQHRLAGNPDLTDKLHTKEHTPSPQLTHLHLEMGNETLIMGAEIDPDIREALS